MTPEQKAILEATAANSFRDLQAMAQVILELAEHSHPPVPIAEVVREELARVKPERYAFGPDASVRAKLASFVSQRFGRVLKGTEVTELLEGVFDILDYDPGHDATSYLCPGQDRTAALDHYRLIIQAIRRGE